VTCCGVEFGRSLVQVLTFPCRAHFRFSPTFGRFTNTCRTHVVRILGFLDNYPVYLQSGRSSCPRPLQVGCSVLPDFSMSEREATGLFTSSRYVQALRVGNKRSLFHPHVGSATLSRRPSHRSKRSTNPFLSFLYPIPTAQRGTYLSPLNAKGVPVSLKCLPFLGD